MPNTPIHGITYPDVNSNLTPLNSHFENLATTTDSALTAVKSNIRGSDSTSTIGSLSGSITAINTRLALNLQTSPAAPTGAPLNAGQEGSMHWDSLNDVLYIYTNSAWKIVKKDTGWQNITMTGGSPNFVADGTLTPQYRVIDNTVHLRGQINPTGTLVAGTKYDFGSVPTGVQPSKLTVFAVHGDSANTPDMKIGRLTISSSGTLSLAQGYAGGSGSGVANYYINCSYPLG